MTDDRELSLVLEAWLRDGPERMPDRVVDSVGFRIARESQQPGWRFAFDRRGGAIDVRLLLVAVIGLMFAAMLMIPVIGRSPSIVPPPIPLSASPMASATSTTNGQTPIPSVSSAAGPGLIVVEVVDTNLDNELRYIAPDRRAVPLLPSFGGHQRTADWRSDGQRLAFAGHPSGQADQWMHVYETDATGTTPRRLSTDCDPPSCIEETDPAYAPDGSRLLVVRLADLRDGRPTRSVLVMYDLTTGRATEIPNTSYPYDTRDIGHPRWSPDGQRIVFHLVKDPPTKRRRLVFPEPTPPGPSSIYVVGVDGSGLRQLTPDALGAGDPDWSRDGSLIVFGPTPWHSWLYGLDQTDWTISTIRPDGTELQVVVGGGDVGTPSWTSDGRILYMGTSGINTAIRVVARDGSGVQDVATFRFRDVVEYPFQQPTP